MVITQSINGLVVKSQKVLKVKGIRSANKRVVLLVWYYYKVSELVFVKMKGLNKVGCLPPGGNIGESRSGNSRVEYRTRPLGERTPNL